MIFAGGMPRASYGDRFTVSIVHGDSHVVLDFTSKVVDFVTLGKSDDRMDLHGESCLVPELLVCSEYVVIFIFIAVHRCHCYHRHHQLIVMELSSLSSRCHHYPINSRPVYRMCDQLAPSGECLRGKGPPDRILAKPWRRLFLAAYNVCAKPGCCCCPA